MKYNKTQNKVLDMTEIFKNSGMAFALSHQLHDEKNQALMSVQTEVLN